jgi:hypothetical protein
MPSFFNCFNCLGGPRHRATVPDGFAIPRRLQPHGDGEEPLSARDRESTCCSTRPPALRPRQRNECTRNRDITGASANQRYANGVGLWRGECIHPSSNDRRQDCTARRGRTRDGQKAGSAIRARLPLHVHRPYMPPSLRNYPRLHLAANAALLEGTELVSGLGLDVVMRRRQALGPCITPAGICSILAPSLYSIRGTCGRRAGARPTLTWTRSTRTLPVR